MAPSTQGASGELGDTARFGGTSASGEVLAGATDVSYAAAIAAHNVGVHIDNAYAIASLIEGAVAGYRSGDALAGSAFASSSSFGVSGLAADAALPASGASGAGLTPVFVGPLPAPKIPRQELTPAPHALNWDSYDTPRLWSMVSREVSDEAWRQMHAFRRLSDALNDQHRRMLALRERLTQAWSPRGAGAEVLAVWDKHTSDLESDAMCAYMTAQAMGNILQTLSDARTKVSRLNETWQHVTSDYLPEWWDHKAELTNAQARVVMVEAEKAIADYRRNIAIPRPTTIVLDKVVVDGSGEPTDASSGNVDSKRPPGHPKDSRRDEVPSGTPSWNSPPSPPPPLPGTSPVVDGPDLAGSPTPVGITPLTPPSTLPIPPNVSELAPGGGAYILPNRWLPDGRLLPMTLPRSSNIGGARPGNTAGVPNQGASLFGMPGPAGGLRQNDRTLSQKTATEKWEVAVGVPPVIQPPDPDPTLEESDFEADEEMERFRQWYKEVSTPWAIEGEPGSESRHDA